MKNIEKIFYLKNDKWIITGMYFIVSILLLLVYFLSIVMGLDIAYFLKEPTALLKVPSYIGIISNLGVFMWSLTVGVCFFTCFVAEDVVDKSGFKFIFYSGIFSFILLVDDFFLLHESIFPRHFHIPQPVLFAVYFLYLVFLIAKFNKYILSVNYVYFIIALFLFINSLTLDFLREVFIFPETIDSIGMFVEDGFKIFGILTWFIFYAKACKNLIVSTKESKIDNSAK